jgi:hypothetical protein
MSMVRFTSSSDTCVDADRSGDRRGVVRRLKEAVDDAQLVGADCRGGLLSAERERQPVWDLVVADGEAGQDGVQLRQRDSQRLSVGRSPA